MKTEALTGRELILRIGIFLLLTAGGEIIVSTNQSSKTTAAIARGGGGGANLLVDEPAGLLDGLLEPVTDERRGA